MTDDKTVSKIEEQSFLSSIQIKYLRNIVQVQVIILILYSFTKPSSPIKLLWRLDPILGLNTILTGTHVPILSLMPAVIMLITATFIGRAFCGWVCPMGLIQDFIFFGKKKSWLPEWFRFVKYVILVGGLIMPVFSGWTFLEWFTPLPMFTQTLSMIRGGISWFHTGIAFFFMFIIFSALFEKRAWCRYICPIGAVLSLPSAFKFIRINLNKNKCIKCLKCDEHCTMGVLDIQNQSGLRWDSECILCMVCRDICPTNAIRASAH